MTKATPVGFMSHVHIVGRGIVKSPRSVSIEIRGLSPVQLERSYRKSRSIRRSKYFSIHALRRLRVRLSLIKRLELNYNLEVNFEEKPII